eukprot:TRINITY_DN18323_c0_g1_i4.p1 TRINITY_DN18323_c0_g1~~TRINITY_DN18323_c0_g1_i4.p1  ORF type:complete len:101 (+),score=11.60 TRINITY_DN18323_c0_g1_i4:262-564(+)
MQPYLEERVMHERLKTEVVEQHCYSTAVPQHRSKLLAHVATIQLLRKALFVNSATKHSPLDDVHTKGAGRALDKHHDSSSQRACLHAFFDFGRFRVPPHG